MIETIVKEYLDEKLYCPVYLEHKSDPPTRYVIFEKTGSSKANFVETATIAIQSYAESLYEACELNSIVKLAMEGIITRPEVAGVHLISDYNFTDTTTKKYRYQAVYNLNIWEG